MKHLLSTRTSVLRQWLRAPGSLSRRLASLGSRFEVLTLRQGPARLHRREAADLAPHHGGRSWVREVLLRVDGQALVWARSVAPRRSLAGPWRALLGLGSRPLARERLPLGGPMRTRLARQWRAATGEPPPRGLLWARSSVFRKHGAPLRVMEVFSPLFATIRPQRLRPRRVHVGLGSSHAKPA